MLMTVFLLYFIFVAVIGVGISVLLINQDKEIRRLKPALEEKTKLAQNNTKELEKFYLEKKQLQAQMDNAISQIEAKLQDERNISALAVKNSEMIKAQLKDQRDEIVKCSVEIQKLNDQIRQLNELRLNETSSYKSEIKKISEELQQANETRLMEVQNERQRWTEILQQKEGTLQKLGTEASSMESVMDTLALISKEMNRRLEDHQAKMKLLDEKSQENMEMIAQLEH